MVVPVDTESLIRRARRASPRLDELIQTLDDDTLDAVRLSVESGYSLGYLAGYSAAQTGVQEAIGLPVRD